MNDSALDPLVELQTTWQRGIPIAAAMGIRVDELQGGALRVRADLAANINVHGTAFAGSLYSVCALTGWGMIWLGLRSRGLAAAIVLAEARIDYLLPVRDDIVCLCRMEDAEFEPAIAALRERSKAVMQMACTVPGRRGNAVRFAGSYALRRA